MLEAGTVGKLVVSGPFVEEFTYLHGWTDTQFVTVKGPRKSSMRWLNTGIQAEMDENGLLYVRN
jgi:acyl-CoA synthetase (AMP-forming)/AMP-acid ligase II